MKTEKSNTPWLDKALTPRDENGLIQSMIFQGGLDGEGNPLYYAVIPPNESGLVDPMLQEEDFAPGGKYYGRIQYAPGYYAGPLGMNSHGFTILPDLYDVKFLNPLFNLPAVAAAIRAEGIPTDMIPAALQVSQALSLAGISSADKEPEVPEEPEGMYLPDAKGKRIHICNAVVRVKCLRKDIAKPKGSYEVELELIQEKTYSLIVPEARLSHLAEHIDEVYPWFSLDPAAKNAAALLEAHIREQLSAVPEVAVVHNSGWHDIRGQKVYAHGGLPSTEFVSYESPESIPVDPSMTPGQAFRSALSVLEIGRIHVTLPLLLTVLVGLLFHLFECAGAVPRFCTVLYGLSGSLKTATAELLCAIFGSRDHASFRDTAAAIDVAVGQYRDRPLLVDDFQPAATAASGDEMRKTLEHLIRLFGDDVAKKRSNSKATAAYGKRPRGSCLITAESLGGSYSSLLRCLLVPIHRGDIDGNRLRQFQENPTLWTTVFAQFLPWVGAHWEVLTEMIRMSFPERRNHFRSMVSEPRLADTGAALLLAAEIFLNYGAQCSAITGEDRTCMLDSWDDTIGKLIVSSAENSREADVAVTAKAAITTALESGQLRIAPSASVFLHGCDGFWDKNHLWLWPDSLMRILRKHCRENHVPCTLQPSLVQAELFGHGLLDRDNEDGKNSFLKRTPVLEGCTPKRPRMLAFYRDQLFPED